MKQLCFLSLIALLSACEPSSAPSNNGADRVDATVEVSEGIAEPAPNGPMNTTSFKVEAPAKAPIVLDFSLDEQSLKGLTEAPSIPHNNHAKLPDFFQAKEPEPRLVSVGGRIIMDEDENIPLIDAIQGAEISIEARIH